MYKNLFKKVFNFTIALIAICLLFFLMISIFVIIFISNSGKVFFKQERPGKNGKVFKIIKFKTMNDNKSKDRTVLPGAERLTQIARFIRFTSLDELLQLLNVFKGDMIIVGSMPLLVGY